MSRLLRQGVAKPGHFGRLKECSIRSDGPALTATVLPTTAVGAFFARVA